jgi:hypothetical protein
MPAITVQAASVTTVIGTVTVGNSVTVSSLPALAAGTAQIGSVTASNLTSALAVYSGGNSDIAVNIKSVGGQAFVQGQTWVPVGIVEGSLPTGTNRIGVVTIGGGTVTIGAGTAQIGSVTASISGTVPVSGTFWQATQAVSLASVPTHGVTLASTTVTVSSLPTISGTVTANIFGKNANSTATLQIPLIAYDEGIQSATDPFVIPVQITNGGGQISGANPLPISGTVAGEGRWYNGSSWEPVPFLVTEDGALETISVLVQSIPAGTNQIGSVTANTFAVQGTAVTTSNFTSTTPSTVLANFTAGRKVLTIFNEGAGNLHICAGATCTTIAYQVRLFAGDYYEVPNHQTTITHSAVFATAGTARVTQVS